MTTEHELTSLLDELYLASREQKTPNPYRMSSCGKCVRNLAYSSISWPADDLSARSIRTFSLGDLIHEEVQAILFAAGSASRFEEEVKLNVQLLDEFSDKSIELTGHIDGVWHSDSGDRLLEIKSATEMALIMRYRAGNGGHMQTGMSEDYLCQNRAYKEALGMESTWLFYNKNTSKLLAFDADPQTDSFYLYRIREKYTALERFLASGEPEPPESLREYMPEKELRYRKETGRMKLKWNCSYCSYCTSCWPQAQLEIVGGKPVHYIV